MLYPVSSKVKKDNCWSEQVLKTWLYRLFRFLGATRYMEARK